MRCIDQSHDETPGSYKAGTLKSNPWPWLQRSHQINWDKSYQSKARPQLPVENPFPDYFTTQNTQVSTVFNSTCSCHGIFKLLSHILATCICTYMYIICIHIYTCMYNIYIYVYLCVYVYEHIYIYILYVMYIYIWIFLYKYVCISICGSLKVHK